MTPQKLKNIDLRNLTRETFMDTLIKIKNFDISGLKLTFGKDDNQGSNSVFLTKIDAQGKI